MINCIEYETGTKITALLRQDPIEVRFRQPLSDSDVALLISAGYTIKSGDTTSSSQWGLSDTPQTDTALESRVDCIVRETHGNGIHAASVREIERGFRALLTRAMPLLEAAAGGKPVSMAAGDLLRDYRAALKLRAKL